MNRPPKRPLDSEADFIVVGAGAAGSVVADRLSASGASVLVLEAGRAKRHPYSRIPAAFSKLFQSRHDWNYHTAAQPHLGGRSLYWPRGKMLGGSTAMNAMIYLRGHRSTFDRWAADGNAGWGFDDLLPQFVALERSHRGESEFHGVDGALNVSALRSPNELSEAFVEAAITAGFARNDDFNGAEQEGFGLYDVTQHNGARASSATAFLLPAMGRTNLAVETGAHVARVMIESGRATGVEWVRGRRRVVSRARREVILCGGAVNTPQLLMLSGIGPADHLRHHGITVHHHAPAVGSNLQDHLVCGPAFAIDSPITLAHAEELKPTLRYLAKRDGMLSSNVAEAGGFVRLGESPMPDIQFHFAPVYFINHGFDSPPSDGMSVGATLVAPKSTGSISLATADPFAAPVIDPNYLGDPADATLLAQGCELAREIAGQAPLRRYVDREFLPGPTVDTEAAWIDFIAQRAETLYHPSGTCAMGPNGSDVVDSQLRVRGVDGLRVADTSIMPSITNGNTQAIAMVIGKQVADFVCG